MKKTSRQRRAGSGAEDRISHLYEKRQIPIDFLANYIKMVLIPFKIAKSLQKFMVFFKSEYGWIFKSTHDLICKSKTKFNERVCAQPLCAGASQEKYLDH